MALPFVLIAAPARAEPFRVTGGIFSFGDGAGVNVSGPAFFVHNTDSNPEDFGVPGLAIEHADPFAGVLPLGGHIIADASGGLTLTDGSLDSVGELVFDLTFDAGPALAHRTTLPGDPFDPGCRAGCAVISATGPFRLSGQLTFFDAFSDVVFQRPLAGTGMATLGFRESFGVMVPFANYRFEAVAPTPEPGTLLLVTSGAVAVLMRRRRNCSRLFPRWLSMSSSRS
jgi:hypothetical protein